jgi:hypothetical protein
MKPQVGDIVQVTEEYARHAGLQGTTRPNNPVGGLVTRLIEWPPDARSVVDCVVFDDPNFANPVQLQTRFVEVVSRA